ncbi:MAG TPA: polyphosphate polymerase domain-containing protein [Sedimentisphaerales bacterium]|nr:polyphosphate polymerase domain-containing protein [Sedimentisphaerales bacterium]
MFEGKSIKQTSGQSKTPSNGGNTGPRYRKDKASTVKIPDKLTDRTLRCRHELKYHISESKAEAIAQFIKPYLQRDRYCKLHRSGDYPIVSLYLDSDDLQLCRESLGGHKNRFKLRIRSYTDEPDYPRFLEIKRRINTIIMKSRARVMHSDVTTLLAGSPLPPENYTADTETINQFQFYMNNIRARPAVLVRYTRQAYEGGSENRVRVTFDRELAYHVTSLPEVRLAGGAWQRNSFTLGGVILEVKFTAHYPVWLNRMVKCFNLRQQSISKYASSIKESCLLKFCAPRLVV